MKKYRIIEDCFCEHYLHEKIKYPRPGLVEKKLNKNDVVDFISEFWNFYGSYIKVRKGTITYDIPLHKLEKL